MANPEHVAGVKRGERSVSICFCVVLLYDGASLNPRCPMAEEYVSYDKYCADLADFRSDMASFREEVRGELSGVRQDMTTLRAELLTHMAQLETRLVRWLLVAAALGGLVCGLIAAVGKLVK